MAKQKNAEKCCENCTYLTGIGEGDHICDVDPCFNSIGWICSDG